VIQMTSPGERRKKKKFKRIPSGRVKKASVKKRGSRKKCALCSKPLSGTLLSRKEAKASLSKKRPSVPFAGELCNVCRARVFEEAFKVKTGFKRMTEVELVIREYVKKAVKKVEG